MRDAMGSSFVFNLIILFTGIILFILVSALSYSKAFKVKNNVLNIIERHGGFTASAKAEVDSFLSKIGYRVISNSANPQCNKCVNSKGTDCVNLTPKDQALYRYCVYKYETNKTVYYGVQSYIYFDVPLVGGFFEIPIYGETKSYYKQQ